MIDGSPLHAADLDCAIQSPINEDLQTAQSPRKNPRASAAADSAPRYQFVSFWDRWSSHEGTGLIWHLFRTLPALRARVMWRLSRPLYMVRTFIGIHRREQSTELGGLRCLRYAIRMVRALVAVLIWCAPLYPQSTQALLAGTVTDSISGLAIGNAPVSCRSAAGGEAIPGRTALSGRFTFAALSPGTVCDSRGCSWISIARAAPIGPADCRAA